MPYRVGRTSLNFLVAIALFAWTSMPPAIVHSHSDGDDPGHRHEVRTTQHDHHHHHDPTHAANHAHAETAALDSVQSRTFATHCHWQLLGFRFALPISRGKSDRHDERDMERAGIIDLADGDGLAAPTGGVCLVAVFGSSFTAFTAFVSQVSTPQESQRQTSSTPLCDSARLERSGVLLA